MLKKTIVAVALSALVAAGTAFAQTNTASTTAAKPLPVVFPIAELGGCGSQSACKTYCDDDANKNACYAYAQTHGLMTTAQITLARKLISQVGPGGCKGDACKTYCADPLHGQVCIEFARTNGFISQDDAAKRTERLQLASTTKQLPPLDIGRPFTTSSTTAPAPKNSDTRPATTKPSPGVNATTKPPVTAPKPPASPSSATGAPASSNSEPNIDYSKPPYHCTPAQAEEGACDAPSDASGQGGSIFFAILHFFGL